MSLFLAVAILLSFSLTGCENINSDHSSSQETGSTSDKSGVTIESDLPAESNNQAESDGKEGSDNYGGTVDTDHTDKDDNGFCDDCGISVTIILDMFAVNDLHGKLCDSSAQPGVDEMTTYLKNAYETEDHVLILSSGDMWQGSSESNLTKGLIVTDWMNELDFVSMTLGNHEFDWGEEYIESNAALAEFPFLAINIFDRDTNKLVDYCTPSVMVERGGAQIGIIGAIGDCYSSISGEHSGGFYFKVGNELNDLVNKEAIRLREAGADFIIYSIHGTHKGSALSENVDIIFEGHTHNAYCRLDSDGIYHIQNGGDNEGVSYAEAVINFANGNSTVRQAEYIHTSKYSSLADDPIVDELMQKYEEQVSESSRVLGTNDAYRNGNELRQLMSELYLKAGIERFGNEYDIVLGGGYFSVRDPGYLAAGQVTLSQLQMLFPFENTLVLCSIKGSDLLSKFINTSNSNYFVSYSEYGILEKDNIDPNGTYYVITDTYSSTYAPNRMTEIKSYTAGIYSYHLLADYVKSGGFQRSETVTYTPISRILEIGNALSPGETSKESYYVKGTVTVVENTTWGNMYIEDEHGNRLYVYGTYDETGSIRYDAMNGKPEVGDTVTLYGQIMNYFNAQNGNSKIEIKNARVIPES